MTGMQKNGMFIVLPYAAVCHLPPLCLSPISGVNSASIKLAPPEAIQWGWTLNRVMWYILNADSCHGPVLLSKTDLSDGFYQLHLTPSGALKLAVPFTSIDGKPMVATPTRLPMGWMELPPAFSAVMKTTADLLNESLETTCHIPPPHPFKAQASKPVSMASPHAHDTFPIQDTGPLRPLLAYVDVYLDDFIKLAQGWLNAL